MQYYNGTFNNNLHDSKSTWKVIKKILKPNSKKQNDFQIEENGTKLSDSTENANFLLMIISHQLHHLLLPKSQMLGLTP